MYVGLWLNRARATAQSGLHVRKGVLSVIAPIFGGTMDEQWFHDISDTKDQAILLRDQANAAKAKT